MTALIHLQSVQLRPLPDTHTFPFSLPVLQSLKELPFETPVTLLVGENGTGKSTLLEGLVCAAEMVVVGSENALSDKSLPNARALAKYFKLSWTKRTHRGFFLRAEDFFGYAKRVNQMRAEMEFDLHEIDKEYKGRSDYARDLAKMSTAHELGSIRRR
ncbi:MAG: AAA family ATPase [Chloroflexi bacterium]|nr:AAA family ATPase [Chloroflexota bacterium]